MMKKYLIIVIVLMAAMAWADSQGPSNPNISANESDAWTDPDNIFADDNSYAVLSTSDLKKLGGYGFSFSIPASTIDSIVILGRGMGSGSTEASRQVYVSWCHVVPNFDPAVDPQLVILNETTEADFSCVFKAEPPVHETINEEVFGILINRVDDGYSDALSIDYFSGTVYYTLPAGSAGQATIIFIEGD